MNKIKTSLIRMLVELLKYLTRGNFPTLVSVSVIVEDSGRFLLVNRSDGLGYSVPGGLPRCNETAEETVEREVREETGYRVVVKGFLGVYSQPGRDPRFPCWSLVYSAAIVSGNRHSSHEGKAIWVAKNNLPQAFAFDNGRMLQDYLERAFNHAYA